MVKRLHVALVYNMKKEIVDEVSIRDAGRDEEEGGIAIRTGTELQQTRPDTYAEWDTEDTILAVKAALEERHVVTMIEANEEAFQKVLQVQPEIVFNIAEGLRGASREAQMPAILEMLGIPYTGSDPVTLGVCLDKSRAKEILSYYNVPTPAFQVLTSLDQLRDFAITLPCIVKPLHEGSSKGVIDSSVVRTREELRAQVDRVLTDYNEPALVERFLSGREFTVALLGNGPTLRVLPIIELLLDRLPKGANPIYSYEAKWTWDQSDHPIEMYQCPARIEPGLEHRIQLVCRQAFEVLRCRDWCRIDVRLDEFGNPNIIELNPLPGILPNPDDHSAFPMAARHGGLPYNAMLNAVLDAAVVRTGLI